MPTPKYIKVNGATYKLAGEDPGATPMEATITLTRRPNFGGYVARLEALSTGGMDTLPDNLKVAEAEMGHEALAKLAHAWNRSGFLD